MEPSGDTLYPTPLYRRAALVQPLTEQVSRGSMVAGAGPGVKQKSTLSAWNAPWNALFTDEAFFAIVQAFEP